MCIYDVRVAGLIPDQEGRGNPHFQQRIVTVHRVTQKARQTLGRQAYVITDPKLYSRSLLSVFIYAFNPFSLSPHKKDFLIFEYKQQSWLFSADFFLIIKLTFVNSQLSWPVAAFPLITPPWVALYLLMFTIIAQTDSSSDKANFYYKSWVTSLSCLCKHLKTFFNHQVEFVFLPPQQTTFFWDILSQN